jgi:hypothetical protein
LMWMNVIAIWVLRNYLGGVHQIHLIYDRDKLWAIVTTVMNLRVPKIIGILLTSQNSEAASDPLRKFCGSFKNLTILEQINSFPWQSGNTELENHKTVYTDICSKTIMCSNTNNIFLHEMH